MTTIGIDVTALSAPQPGGIGMSQFSTIRALAGLSGQHNFILYAATSLAPRFAVGLRETGWRMRIGSGPTTLSNILWMQTGVNRLLAEDGVDVFWSPRHLLPFRASGIATVATVQDLWHLHYPEQQPPLNRMLNRVLIDRITRVADRIVTTSQAVAQDLVQRMEVSSAQIDVVPLGVDTSIFSPADGATVEGVLRRFGVRTPYVLCLDVYNPRKNFDLVLSAFSASAPEGLGSMQIVGLGRRRATAQGFDPVARARAAGLHDDRVRFLDDVSLPELVALYSGAAALAYPSVYEGFGMPLLEAMACGCPVVTSDVSSMPEVLGAAGILVHPDDAQGLATAVAQLAFDEHVRARVIAAGRRRSAECTWERTASGMLASFERALASATTGAA